MYERKFTGRNCPTGYVPAAELAKLMRADIKAAIKAGLLPGGARNYTVKVDNYAGGRSINIRAIDLDGMWTTCKDQGCNHWDCDRGDRRADILTPAGEKVQRVLKDIHSSYNYDASESQFDYFDVNFYGQAQVETPWEQRSRLAEKARKAARKVAA